jgi:hypothetical protein
LEFQEADAPLVRLGVRASVHRPVSCSQKIAVINPVRVGTQEERLFKVSNFSGKKWSDLSVEKTAEWVSVQMHRNPNASDLQGEDPPLEVWNVALTIHGSSLSEGWNVATLVFRPEEHGQIHDQLVVRAYRSPAVSVEPSTVFCGIVERGEALERTLRFTFRDASQVPTIEGIRTTIARVPMTLRWRQDREDPAALLLDTTIGTTGDTLTDVLEVDFGQGRQMQIPVRGAFRASGPGSGSSHGRADSKRVSQ